MDEDHCLRIGFYFDKGNKKESDTRLNLIIS